MGQRHEETAKILCDNKGQHPGGALGSAWGVGTQGFSRKWRANEARRLTELTGCGGWDGKEDTGELSATALRGHLGELQIASKG